MMKLRYKEYTNTEMLDISNIKPLLTLKYLTISGDIEQCNVYITQPCSIEYLFVFKDKQYLITMNDLIDSYISTIFPVAIIPDEPENDDPVLSYEWYEKKLTWTNPKYTYDTFEIYKNNVQLIGSYLETFYVDIDMVEGDAYYIKGINSTLAIQSNTVDIVKPPLVAPELTYNYIDKKLMWTNIGSEYSSFEVYKNDTQVIGSLLELYYVDQEMMVGDIYFVKGITQTDAIQSNSVTISEPVTYIDVVYTTPKLAVDDWALPLQSTVTDVYITDKSDFLMIYLSAWYDKYIGISSIRAKVNIYLKEILQKFITMQ